MDNNNNKLLEEYFKTSTSEERRSEIRNELLRLNPDDPDRILFELGEEVEVEKKVSKLSSNIESIANNKGSNWPLRIAASIVFILASVFIGIELLKPTASNDAIFDSYFLPYDGVDISRDNTQSEYQGLPAYNAQQYEEAIVIFQNEWEVTSNPELALLIASCYLSINEPEQALNMLDQITDDVNRKLIFNRDWYKALALVKMDQLKEARTLVQEIIEMKSPYSEKATKLLSNLSSQ